MAAKVSGFADSGESDSSDDNFSEEKEKSLTDPHFASKKVLDPKEKRERRRFFLCYRDFLLQVRSVNERQTTKDSSETQSGEAEEGEENYGLYADDKGYLQGEIYRQLENDKELGFAGELSQELNLIPSDNAHVDVTDLQGTFQDSEPEILVVPNKRFVREISPRKKKKKSLKMKKQS